MTTDHTTTAATWIDTHVHVWDEASVIARDSAYRPAYLAPFTQTRALWDAHGVAAGVLVQPSFLGTDNDMIARTLASDPTRLRAIIVADPIRDMPRLSALDASGVRGIRFNLISSGPLPDLETPVWRGFAAALRDLGWHVLVAAPAPVLRSALSPLRGLGLPIVIDHFGMPDPVTGSACPAWRAILQGGARAGDLWLKTSAAYRLSRVPPIDLWPVVLDLMPMDRVIWGSDWPWTRHERGRSMAEAQRAPLAGLPDAHRAAVTADNARRLYGF